MQHVYSTPTQINSRYPNSTLLSSAVRGENLQIFNLNRSTRIASLTDTKTFDFSQTTATQATGINHSNNYCSKNKKNN